MILVYQNLYQFLKPEKSSGFQPVSNPKPENLKLVDPSAMPDKDVFWTSETEENSHEYNSDRERNPALQTALAVLSAGVVGPGDGLGYENEELIMSTCRSDGLLLMPDFPLTMPHSQFIYNVFENPKVLDYF